MAGNVFGNAGNARRVTPRVRTPVTLEWLLDWAFVRQRVAQLCGLVNGTPSLQQASDWVSLGTSVQVSAGRGAALPTDALTLYAAIGRLPQAERAAVTHCAEVGKDPDAMAGVRPWPVPYPRDPRGRGTRNRCRIEMHPPQKRTVKIKQYPACPVHYVPTWAEIITARERYNAWHAGMTWLSDQLWFDAIELIDYRLSRRFDKPAEPWQAAAGRPVRHARATLELWLLPNKAVDSRKKK